MLKKKSYSDYLLEKSSMKHRHRTLHDTYTNNNLRKWHNSMKLCVGVVSDTNACLTPEHI
jgi:hypothetical protein